MIAASAARVGPEGLPLAVVLVVAARTGRAVEAGVVVAAATFPQLVLGPVLAPVLDRSPDPWPRLASAAAVNAAAITGLAVTVGRVTILVPAVLALAVSATEPLLTGGLSAWATRAPGATGLAPPAADPAGPGSSGAPGPDDPEARGSTTRIQAWDSLAYHLGGLAAPALVTTLAVTTGPASATVALAAGSALAAVALWSLSDRTRPGAGCRARSGGSERDGSPGPDPLRELQPERGAESGDDPGVAGRHLARALRALATEPDLRAVTVSTTLAQGALGAMTFAAVAAAAGHGREAAAGGQILTGVALGAVLGSVVMTRTPPTRRPWLLVAAALAGGGTALVTAGALPWPGVLAAAAVLGFLDAPLLVGTFGARTIDAPPDVQATVFVVAAGGKLAAGSLGALLGGWLLDGRATTAGLTAVGAALLVAVAVGLAVGPAGGPRRDRLRSPTASPGRPPPPAHRPSRRAPPSG